MIIVLDTNVLVAGLLSPFGPCGAILRWIASGNLALAFDSRILSEYSDVLARPKFGFPPEKIAALLEQIEHQGFLVPACPSPRRLPDPDDEPFLEVALASGGNCIVTGNKAHFPPELCRPIKVIAPADFLALFRKGLEVSRKRSP